MKAHPTHNCQCETCVAKRWLNRIAYGESLADLLDGLYAYRTPARVIDVPKSEWKLSDSVQNKIWSEPT